jgi:Zn-dependent protease
MDIVINAIIIIFVVVYSSILHEIAHGYVAYRLGDPTAKILGRLTLNPRKHIDPFMSIIFPLLLILSGSPIIFGGAKPVPVDPFNLRDGRKDLALVSLAGPLTNILLAILAAVIIHIAYPAAFLTEIAAHDLIGLILVSILRLNILLAMFNLIPIPPLDGSKVFAMILPQREAAAYLSLGSIGMFIIFMLLFINLGPFSLMGLMQSLQNFCLTILGF